MWLLAVDCKTGAVITDARFNFDWENEGSGWYWVYVGKNEDLCVQAPGYGQVCGNTDNYGSMKATLCPSSPPPPPSCGCWS
jgi:hypothetical protein